MQSATIFYHHEYLKLSLFFVIYLHSLMNVNAIFRSGGYLL